MKTRGEVAKQFGVSLRVLRFWEQEGLVVPAAGRYDDACMTQINYLIRARKLGFSLLEIKELLDLHRVGMDRGELRRKVQLSIVELERDLAATEARLRDFRAIEAELNEE